MAYCKRCKTEFEFKSEALPDNHYCKIEKATLSPYETKVRRQAQRRLGSRPKIHRLRDREDISGFPDVVGRRRAYGQYMYKGNEVKFPSSNVAERFADNVRRDMPKFLATDIPGYAKYLADRYARELERSTIDGITTEMDKALKIVRTRAEKQLAQEVPETRSEHEYLSRLKLYVIKQVQKSASKWQAELQASLATATPESVWRILVDKEYEVKNAATTAARTLLGDIYNSYMGWLLGKKTDGKFKWMNPMDKSTSLVCKKIVQRTEKGVTLDELKEIVRQEADKGWYRARSPLLPHPNCRSTLILV
jgi:hypothetical protein